MPITDHPLFTHPPDPTILIWRYMDIAKFAALLQRRALVFSRADKLGDPFEGSVPAGLIRTMEQARKFRLNRSLTPPETEEKLDQLLRAYSQVRQRLVRAHHISCWHMNERESAAMWKLYSRSSDAVCIQTEYQTLATLLPEICHMGVVEYVDFRTETVRADYFTAPFLLKRLSFAHEREARAIIPSTVRIHQIEEPEVKLVDIDLNRLIQNVYIAPDASNWFKDVVENLCRTYGLDVEVHHSELNDTPLY